MVLRLGEKGKAGAAVGDMTSRCGEEKRGSKEAVKAIYIDARWREG